MRDVLRGRRRKGLPPYSICAAGETAERIALGCLRINQPAGVASGDDRIGARRIAEVRAGGEDNVGGGGRVRPDLRCAAQPDLTCGLEQGFRTDSQDIVELDSAPRIESHSAGLGVDRRVDENPTRAGVENDVEGVDQCVDRLVDDDLVLRVQLECYRAADRLVDRRVDRDVAGLSPRARCASGGDLDIGACVQETRDLADVDLRRLAGRLPPKTVRGRGKAAVVVSADVVAGIVKDDWDRGPGFCGDNLHIKGIEQPSSGPSARRRCRPTGAVGQQIAPRRFDAAAIAPVHAAARVETAVRQGLRSGIVDVRPQNNRSAVPQICSTRIQCGGRRHARPDRACMSVDRRTLPAAADKDVAAARRASGVEQCIIADHDCVAEDLYVAARLSSRRPTHVERARGEHGAAFAAIENDLAVLGPHTRGLDYTARIDDVANDARHRLGGKQHSSPLGRDGTAIIDQRPIERHHAQRFGHREGQQPVARHIEGESLAGA